MSMASVFPRDDTLKSFAHKVCERIRLDDGGYRRNHLRALTQRVEVADDEVRIMGWKSELVRWFSEFWTEMARHAG